MKKLLLVLFVLFLLPLPKAYAESPWYYPIGNYQNRQSLKTFDQLWSKNDYIGKEALFPSQFTGYHTAIDLETSSDEADQAVPIFAIADGTITFAGPVSGYGKVILESIGENHTALFGHVKPSVMKGQTVQAGDQIAVLGKGFSNETAGERKHLHFGIYKGTDQYFKGYETTQVAVKTRWEDPTSYLTNKGAKEVVATPRLSPTPTATTQPQATPPKQGWWTRFTHWLSSLF